jgi:diguanylate cyclase (GGDEF)-like protein
MNYGGRPTKGNNDVRRATYAALKQRGMKIPAILSQRFADYLDEKTRPFIRVVIVIGALAYFSFAVADFLVVRDMFLVSVTLRLIFLATALTMGEILIRQVRSIYRLECLLPVLVHCSVPIWYYILANSSSPDVPVFAHASVIFVLLLNIGIRGRFSTALISSLTLTAMVFYAIWRLNDGNWLSVFLYSLVYTPVMVFSLVISWYNAFNERRLFLLNMIDKFNNEDLRQANSQLWVQAHTDELTALPNRSLLQDRLSQALVNARRKKTKVACLFVDLDNFKPVNDTHGHAVGDRLLQLVADRMANLVRASDTVARYGGDEFVVVLSDLDSQDAALLVANNIVDAMSEPFLVDHVELTVGCSIGIALYPDHGDDEQTLQQAADQAVYQAKLEGKQCAKIVS